MQLMLFCQDFDIAGDGSLTADITLTASGLVCDVYRQLNSYCSHLTLQNPRSPVD